MQVGEALRKISPPHIVIEGLHKEHAIKAEHDLPWYALPTETGVRDYLEIQKIRLKTIVKATGATALIGTPIAAAAITVEAGIKTLTG